MNADLFPLKIFESDCKYSSPGIITPTRTLAYFDACDSRRESSTQMRRESYLNEVVGVIYRSVILNSTPSVFLSLVLNFPDVQLETMSCHLYSMQSLQNDGNVLHTKSGPNNLQTIFHSVAHGQKRNTQGCDFERPAFYCNVPFKGKLCNIWSF